MFSRFDEYTRVTDGRTDRQMELAWHIRAIAYMLSRVKTKEMIMGTPSLVMKFPPIQGTLAPLTS